MQHKSKMKNLIMFLLLIFFINNQQSLSPVYAQDSADVLIKNVPALISQNTINLQAGSAMHYICSGDNMFCQCHGSPEGGSCLMMIQTVCRRNTTGGTEVSCSGNYCECLWSVGRNIVMIPYWNGDHYKNNQPMILY